MQPDVVRLADAVWKWKGSTKNNKKIAGNRTLSPFMSGIKTGMRTNEILFNKILSHGRGMWSEWPTSISTISGRIPSNLPVC